jgi:hypothetical protein
VGLTACQNDFAQEKAEMISLKKKQKKLIREILFFCESERTLLIEFTYIGTIFTTRVCP